MKTKHINSAARCAAALLAVIFAVFAVIYANPVKAESDKPEISIQLNTTNAFPGDTIVVSFYIKNNTGVNITSLSGEIAYNSDHFKYLGCSSPDSMKDSAEHQTVSCVDESGALKFTFADTTDSVLTSTGRSVLMLELRLSVLKSAGYGSITGRIRESYYGDTAYPQISIVQQTVSVTVPDSPSTQQTTATTKPASNDARLSSLSLTSTTKDGISLSAPLPGGFNPEFVAYTVEVSNDVEKINIDATASNSEATVSGKGVRDLNVGSNNFTVTVTAGDGTTRQYGLIIIRAQEAPTVLTSTNSDFVSGADIVTESTTTSTTMPTFPTSSLKPQTQTIISLSDLDNRNTSASDNDFLRLIGIVFGEVALFFFGFLCGYFIDKNIKKKNEAEKRLEELSRRESTYSGYDNSYNNSDYTDTEEYDEQYEQYDQYDQYDQYEQYEQYEEYSGEYSEGYDQYAEYDELGNVIGYTQNLNSQTDIDNQDNYYYG